MINTVALIHLMLYERVLKKSALVENLLKFNRAEDALTYLEDAQSSRIDIIFLDINMPRMDGFGFLKAATETLGNNFADAVVVMLTTSLDPTDRKKAESFEAVKAFLNKPLTEETLQDIVKLI